MKLKITDEVEIIDGKYKGTKGFINAFDGKDAWVEYTESRYFFGFFSYKLEFDKLIPLDYLKKIDQ